MKIYKLKTLKLFCLAILAIVLLARILSKHKKEKEKGKTETPVTPPKKATEKKISDLIKSSKEIDGLFKMYRDTITGSLQMLITEEQFGKEYIHFNQIENGVLEANSFKGAYGGSKVFKVKKYFNKIEFITQNTSYYFDPDNAISRAKDANMSEGNMASLKIEAHDKKKGHYLIKADDLF